MGNWWLIPILILIAVFTYKFLVKKIRALRLKRNRVLIKKKIFKNYHVVASAVLVLLFMPMFGYVLNFSVQGISSEPEHWGQMGDFFGGMLNPVLAFASFMALLYTINIQSKQLDVSTKELEATRQEIKASRKAQEKSSEAAEAQLSLFRNENSEAIFYKSLEKLKSDIDFVKKSSFLIDVHYSGKEQDNRNSTYYFNRKNVEKRLSMDYSNFYKLFSKDNNLMLNVESGQARLHRTPVHPDSKAEHHLPDGTTGKDLIEVLARNTMVFNRLFLSLNYALDSIEQIKKYRLNSKDFTLYYYSYIEGVVDRNLLTLLAMFCSRNKVIEDHLLKEFKFFERLDIDNNGFILSGPVHINELIISPEAFGNNAGYLYGRAQSEKPESS